MGGVRLGLAEGIKTRRDGVPFTAHERRRREEKGDVVVAIKSFVSRTVRSCFS